MHDVNGTRLSVGDTVVIYGKIKSLSEGTPDYCNVSVESIHGRRPDGAKETMSAINTGVLTLVEKAKVPPLTPSQSVPSMG